MQEDFGNRVLFFAYIKSHCEFQERNHLNIKSRNTCINRTIKRSIEKSSRNKFLKNRSGCRLKQSNRCYLSFIPLSHSVQEHFSSWASSLCISFLMRTTVGAPSSSLSTTSSHPLCSSSKRAGYTRSLSAPEYCIISSTETVEPEKPLI